MDNVLIAYKLIHALNGKRSERKEYMTMKLDMSKAYDRVEWLFLEALMRKMKFSEGRISRIKQCVSTIPYSILLNGRPGEFFKPHRGLRQGDPLLPYLVVICAEGLSSLLMVLECLRRGVESSTKL